MKSSRVFLLFLLALLSGCADSQAPNLIAPSAGKSVVFIYRIDSVIGADILAPNVRVNDASIGALTRRGYFRVEVNPGPTQVTLYTNDQGSDTFWPVAQNSVVNLKLAPNSTYFVELSLDSMTYHFRETSREKALDALADAFLLN